MLKQFNIHQFGQGSKFLLCFHGFGQEGNVFEPLEAAFGHQFKILAIDAPFHGATSQKDFTPAVLFNLMEELKAHYNFRRYSVLGYSMGCRMAGVLYNHDSSVIDELCFIAPDGIKQNPFFTAATTWAKPFFRLWVQNPQPFLWLVRCSFRLQLINRSFLNFVEQHTEEVSLRKQLFATWQYLHCFHISMLDLKRNLERRNGQLGLVLGQYDRIIPVKIREKLMHKKVPHEALILAAGHHLLKPKYMQEIYLLVKRASLPYDQGKVNAGINQ